MVLDDNVSVVFRLFASADGDEDLFALSSQQRSFSCTIYVDVPLSTVPIRIT